MPQEYKLKRMTPKQLKGKMRIGSVLVVTGLLVAALSIVVGVWLNMDRYGGHGVKAATVAAKVTGCESVIVEDEHDGAFVTQGRWYLVAEYQYNGETHTSRLDEYYVDKSYVQQDVGSVRELHIDTATFEVLEERPLTMLFLVPAVAGFVAVIGGALLRFRYTDYSYRMSRKKRPGKGQPAFVMRRGAGI